jgi:signal transduction histidine kinase/ActR/RegA family two-component response regulator
MADFKSPRHEEIEFRIVTKNGEIKWLSHVCAPIYENDLFLGRRVSNRDITDRKRLEDQLMHSQRLESIGTLAGGIAHDFNNILTAITGYGHILKMKAKEGDPSKAYIEQILASAERAANLTQSLLAFSRKQISAPEPVKLKGIIENVKRVLQRLIGENIELRTEVQGEELTAMADSAQIEQVLVNLCTNARDAMPEGGVLAVKMKRVSGDKMHKTIGTEAEGLSIKHDKGYAEITIIDTGTGMDEKTRERIFEPFFTTKEVGKGTGLGLSMVYGIIKQHHGHISVDSEEGKGTTFRIYLPLTETAVSKDIKTAEAATAITGGPETILLAEDEDAVRKLTRIVLEEFGYTVIEASDGQEAVSKFMENKDRIGLFLTDIVMPVMNGREAYERIKKIKPKLKVLFASGYPSDFTHKSEILAEGLDFIGKPVSPDNLLKKVREVLDTPK